MAAKQRKLYLAAYDVRDSGRRRAVLLGVRAYATGGQKSAHECWLSRAEKKHLLNDMTVLLDLEQDRFLLVRLDGRQQITTLGVALPPVDPAFFYLG